MLIKPPWISPHPSRMAPEDQFCDNHCRLFDQRMIIFHLVCLGMLPCSQPACINFTKTCHLCPNPSWLCSSSLRTMSESHTLMCFACSPVVPAAHPFWSSLTTVRSSPSLGMSSKMLALSTWMERGSLFEATFPYRATRLAVWAASDFLLALGVQLVAAFYHPLRVHHTSLDSQTTRCPSISPWPTLHVLSGLLWAWWWFAFWWDGRPAATAWDTSGSPWGRVGQSYPPTTVLWWLLEFI